MPTGVLPARELPRDELWNLVGTVRHDLAARGEILPAAWVDETVDAIGQGVGTAWYAGERTRPSGLAILWVRDGRGYGHLHATQGPASVLGMVELARRLTGELPADVTRLDMGSTGLAQPDEQTVGQALREDRRFTTLLRHSMVRPLTAEVPPPDPRWPEGADVTTVRRIPLEQLTGLDWRTYRGTPDETLLSASPEGNRELLENALAGLFGKYLDDASPAVRDSGGRLLGFAIGCEESLRSGVVLDIAVDPEFKRRGIGRALLLRCLRGLLALGYSRAHLWVTDGNAPARALYEKVGFVEDTSATIYRWVRSSGGQ